jgi:hypothetical protein
MNYKLFFKIAHNAIFGNAEMQIKQAIADAKLEGDTAWLEHEETKAFLKKAMGYFNPVRREIRNETIVTHWIRVAHAVWNSPLTHDIGYHRRRLGTFAALAHDAQEEAAILDEKIGGSFVSWLFTPAKTAGLYHKTRSKKQSDQIESKQFILHALGKLFDWEIKNDFERILAQIKTIKALDLNKQDDLLLGLIKYIDKKDNLNDNLADLLAGKMSFTSLEKVRDRVIKLRLNREVILAMPEPVAAADKVKELKEEFFVASSQVQYILTQTYGVELTKAFGADWANLEGYHFSNTYREVVPQRSDLAGVIAAQKVKPFVPKQP